MSIATFGFELDYESYVCDDVSDEWKGGIEEGIEAITNKNSFSIMESRDSKVYTH